jgi:glycerophosphoryl diester phosphodiesterase
VLIPRNFVVTGHRGAMALESENTLASFLLARDLGADEIEFDVRRTVDGVAVVHHDEHLGRVVNGVGALRDHTAQELSLLRVEQRHRIPELHEVLALSGIGFQLEIKDARDAEAVTTAVLRDPCRNDRVLTTSFRASALTPALEASLRTGLICGPGDTESLRLGAALGVDQLLVHWSVADHKTARDFAENGGTLTVWPTADARTAAQAVETGYGGTTCDDPSIAIFARRATAAVLPASGEPPRLVGSVV